MMAFVNELVPEEEKAKLDPTIFYRPYSFNKAPIEAYKWTIDRERDIFLILLAGQGSGGGQGDGYIPPEYYALSWQRQVTKFDARIWSTGNFIKGDMDLYWEIFNVNIPPALENRRSEVIELIQEAINAKAIQSISNPEWQYRSINITFK